MKALSLASCVALFTLLDGAASAQGTGQAGASGSVSGGAVGGSTSASAASSVVVPGTATGPEYDDPTSSWWMRHRPLPMAFEVGAYGGATWISNRHNLQNLDIVVQQPGQPHRTYPTSPQWGLRVGLYPYTWVGAEAELGLIHTSTVQDDATAVVLAPRGHVVFQLPFARLVPFVLVGGGAYSLTRSSMGKDTDPAFHFGGGFKLALTDRVTFRIDMRDALMQKNKLDAGVSNGDVVHTMELLLGVSMTFGRTALAPPPPDTDGDGVADPVDRCPTEPAKTPDGCPPPPPPKDSDGDGIPDELDRCPTEKEDGLEPEPKDGCPNKDADKDGIPIPQDRCPEVAGVEPDGCPPKDTDGDGILDKDDKCPDKAETKNGFQDEDGCPDELPKEIAKFTGVIQGITFDTAKATLRPASFPLLDDAVKVLTQYPTLRIRISGHTDNQGPKDVNQKLSEDRAAAVKTYLTGKGIQDSRIETRGVGPDEPLEDNKSEAGRAKNRRIEFAILP